MARTPKVSSAVAAVLVLVAGVGAPRAQDGGIESLRESARAFASVARAVAPSVVFIRVEATVSGGRPGAVPSPFGEQWPFGEEFFRRFFGEPFPGQPPRGPSTPRERRATGQGSGFVFNVDGSAGTGKAYILTNSHVVANADAIRVTFQDGRELEARLKGTDPQSDVAVIEIDTSDVPALALGDSSRLQVGEWVVAMGNPFGLSHTLTVGVVSAKGRTSLGITDYEDFIQTDAAINPGNSGGPLVNLDAEVVGINTAIFSRTGGHMGVGFAIPINLARSIADQLIAHGEVTRGFLGVTIQSLTAELAESFGIERTQGVVVSQVSPGTPAADAGLRPGDVIVAYRGEPAVNVGSLRNRIAMTRPGSREELTILRDGERRNVTVTIGKLTRDRLASGGAAESTAAEIGLTVQTLNEALARELELPPGRGVVVSAVTPGSIAARAGLEPGVVILEVNQQPIANAGEFERAVARSQATRRLLLLVRKGDGQQFIVLRW